MRIYFRSRFALCLITKEDISVNECFKSKQEKKTYNLTLGLQKLKTKKCPARIDKRQPAEKNKGNKIENLSFFIYYNELLL